MTRPIRCSKNTFRTIQKRPQKETGSGNSYETLEPRNLLAADFLSANFVPDHVTLRTPQILMADVLVRDQVTTQGNVVTQAVEIETVKPKSGSQEGVWQAVSKLVLESEQVEGKTNYIKATDFGLLELDEPALRSVLKDAPLELTPKYRENAVTLSIPTPDNSFSRFAIVESPIMEPELAAKFPNIKTYIGYGIDDPGASVRLDVTHQGFHAAVRSPNQPDYYVDPYFHLDTSLYMTYFTKNVEVDPLRGSIEELVFSDTGELLYSNTLSRDESNAGVTIDHDHDDHDHDDHDHDDHDHDDHDHDDHGHRGDASSNSSASHGSELRTFSLAVAATGEYTTFHGGTVADGQAAIVTAMNRVNGIYENDVAVRMVLVANNDLLVYTNGATDPYTNDEGVDMLGENQTNVDNVIGNANYDIGHVFSTGGGGIAGLGVIGQTNVKARGVTGLPNPNGDAFWVDFVSHEMGHQFAGTHTFNGDSGSCAGGNRSGSTAYEPGSGTTIQAYAGICGGDNLQGNSDAFFHSASIDQIRNEVTTGAGGAAAEVTNLTNNIPSVDAGVSFVIPDQTPFELTAVGIDADASDVLTYSWEQRDLGVQRDVNASDNGSSPIFRAFLPTTNPTRSFPQLSDILNGVSTIGEQLPTTDWASMDFRVVVRDNVAGGGAVSTDDVSLQVVNSGSGFAITSQNSSTVWEKGDTETITWDVAGTTTNGINAANVDILFSTDNGQTFGTTLASSVSNDGSFDITVPDVSTAAGRIKVKASDNIFFDINNSPIEIDVSTTTDEYNSGDTPVDIVDNATITSTITVPDAGEITDVDLRLNITHSYVSDLTVTLMSPEGEVRTLFSGIGNSGFNFTNTHFDDAADTAIGAGTAPFTGSFRPADAFVAFNGETKQGDWVLSIADAEDLDDGSLDSWSLNITTVNVSNENVGPVTDSDGAANEVNENSAVGVSVGITASATDPDVGDTVSYSLTSDAGGLFEINATTGVVTVKAPIDYETATSHMITAQALSSDGSMTSEDFTVAILNEDDAALVSRNFYYEGSSFDNGSLGGAPGTKAVLLPGKTATFENYTSYSKGINGFVLEFEDLNQAPTLATVGDYFEFHIGNNDMPDTWAVAAAPTGLVYENNVGGGTTDRVFLTWADNAIEKTWLEIKVLASATTGLATEDVFYLGNAIGETGSNPANAIVNLIDVAAARSNQTGFGAADIDNAFDFDRDGRVNLVDVAIARSNQSGFTPLKLITPTVTGGRSSTIADGSKGDGQGLKQPGFAFSFDSTRFDSTSFSLSADQPIGFATQRVAEETSNQLGLIGQSPSTTVKSVLSNSSDGSFSLDGNQSQSQADVESLNVRQLDIEFSNF